MVKSSGNGNSSGGAKQPHSSSKASSPNTKSNSGNSKSNGSSSQGFNSNAITPQYIPTYNAPSYNDPNSPMSKAPTAVDSSVINDNIYGSTLPKGELKKLQGNIIPKRNNKLLQGTNNRTIISGDYYATGEVHTLKPDLPQFDAPSTFQMGLPQNGQTANYAGQPMAFGPEQAAQANSNIPPLPQINPAQPAPGQMPAAYPASYPPQAYAQYQQYQQYQQYPQYAQYPNQGYAYPPQGMPAQPAAPAPATPTTFIEGQSPEQTHAQPKPAPAPVYGSIDYLNYIEPEALKNQHKPIDSKLFVFAGVGATVVVVVVSVMAALSAQENGPLAGLGRVQQNIANVQSVLNYAQKNQSVFTRKEFRSMNETLLTVSTQEQELFKNLGMGARGRGKYKPLKADRSIWQKLDDSRAQGQLDRDLLTVLHQQLDKLISSIKSVAEKVKRNDQRAVVDTATKDITTVLNRFDASVQEGQALDRVNSAADAATIDRKKPAAKEDKTSSDKPKTVTGDPDSAGK